jgi:glyoxylase-like metal-dependent hydrolase (beta-lactamase superfamily II)
LQVEELVPGLWRWTGRHPELEREVGCVYYESADGVCLIDPLVPPEEPDRFLQALDRDVARIGGPVHVLLTVPRHARSAVALVARYGGDDRPPRDVEALASGREGEVLYWLPGPQALVAGEAIVGGLRLARPESREALLPLLDLPVERVLVSHGEPVRSGGAAALRELLSPRPPG